MDKECPEIEVLAAYVDHCLLPEERTEVEAHLVECSLCRKTIALTFTSKSIVGFSDDPACPAS